MAIPPADPSRYRRQQRRRAAIAWVGGVAAVALVVLAAALGGGEGEVETFTVPYGETMTTAEYEAIGEGEDQAEVLGRLGKSGRPERLTEDFVLVLFPPPSEEVACSYWQISDEPQIFARLCFDRSDGELVEKLDADVHDGLEGDADGVPA